MKYWAVKKSKILKNNLQIVLICMVTHNLRENSVMNPVLIPHLNLPENQKGFRKVGTWNVAHKMMAYKNIKWTKYVQRHRCFFLYTRLQLESKICHCQSSGGNCQ